MLFLLHVSAFFLVEIKSYVPIGGLPCLSNYLLMISDILISMYLISK